MTVPLCYLILLTIPKLIPVNLLICLKDIPFSLKNLINQFLLSISKAKNCSTFSSLLNEINSFLLIIPNANSVNLPRQQTCPLSFRSPYITITLFYKLSLEMLQKRHPNNSPEGIQVKYPTLIGTPLTKNLQLLLFLFAAFV